MATRRYRGINPEYNDADTEVTSRWATKEEMRSKKGPLGGSRNNYIKQAKEPGDKQLAFGRLPKDPSFQGGEGGRGWAVRSTYL